jgi:ABC-type transport system involved in multi-copper enzyme maturation permease subunit
MILQIIRKEILQGFLSLRLPLTLILVAGVMISGAFLFIENYQQQLADYSRNVEENLGQLSRRADGSWYALYSVLSFNDQWVYRAPARLAFLAEGHEKDLPNAFQVDAFTSKGPKKKLRGNYLVRKFEDLDWAFVVSVVMSFVAIVMVFDSISGERENGTLRLSMSNPVPRSTIILGKYLGTMVVLIIPLLIGMLSSMIIIAASGEVSIVGADWIRIGMTILLSILYISIFVVLGLFASSLLRSSAASLVILLLAWAVIVVVIPDTGGAVATSLWKFPSMGVVFDDVHAAYEKAYQDYNARHPNAGRWMSGNWSPRENLGRAMALDDAEMRVYKSYWDKMVAQVRFGYNATRVSPTTVYRRAVEAVAGSGVDHYESFMNQVEKYRFLLRDFLLDHYPLDIHQQYDDSRKFREALSARTFAAADVPKFRDEPIPMEDSMKNSTWDIAILFIFNVVFFMAAYISFLNRDVR